MSLLRNPWVTGVLAAAAVGVVGYQFLAPQLRSRGSTPARLASAAAPRADRPVRARPR